ncbi:MAG: hypothetical protein R8G01_23140 [Ilumatobacteraceae bacterium]|nr:hypothetical protein [Ilumatobacteraceae bacterium]
MLIAGVVATAVQMLAFTVLFGNPAVESLLFEAGNGQTDSVLEFWQGDPPPTITPYGDVVEGSRLLAVMGMLTLWGIALAAAFEYVRASLPSRWFGRGIAFGVGAWALAYMFFETWVPYNALHEPFGLVLVELGLELIGMLAVGVALAAVLRDPEPVIELDDAAESRHVWAGEHS